MLVVDDFIPAPQGSSLRVRETRRKEKKKKIREIIFQGKNKKLFLSKRRKESIGILERE